MTSLGATGIPYADYGWPLVTGCTKVGAGCQHCYAACYAATRGKHLPQYAGLARYKPDYSQPDGKIRTGYDWTGEVRFHAALLDAPLHTRKPGRVFVCPTGDLFHPGVTDEQLDKAFAVMAATPHLTYLVVTKRPQWMHDYIVMAMYDEGCDYEGWYEEIEKLGVPDASPMQNVVLLPSVWDQESADRVIPLLLDTPAAVRGISLEPMLRAVELDGGQARSGYLLHASNYMGLPAGRPRLDLVICGPETGPGKRPFDPAWAFSVKEQCDAAGVAYYDKRQSRAAWREWPGVTS